jgi:putative hydrolase of the HAD superfamily
MAACLIMTSGPLKGIAAVIFDLGDTLYTLSLHLMDYHRRFLQEVCGEQFQVSEEALQSAHNVAERVMGEYLVQSNAGPRYLPTREDWVRFDTVLLRELGIVNDLEERGRRYQGLWDRLLKSQRPSLRPGAREVLRELKRRGYKLGVAANWEESPTELLRESGVATLFGSTQFTAVYGYSKPSPYMLIMNAVELEVNPLRCAFVGNSIKTDVLAARRAGMTPVLLAQRSQMPSGLDPDVVVIYDVEDLLDILPSLSSSS